MEQSTFNLIIIAIVAAALIFIAGTYFSQPRQELMKELGKGIDYAEGNEGKT